MIRILIADDSAIVRSMLGEILNSDERFETAGFAENGEQAVELNKSLSPDLIVMDVNMPVKNGIDATKEILSCSNPAVVIFTTEDTVETAFRLGLTAGALDIIKKPNFAVMTQSMLKDFADKLFFIGEKRKRDLRLKSKLKLNEKQLPLFPPVQDKRDDGGIKKYRLVVIGSSTGGPAALQKVLSGLKKDFPLPVLITQHIDPVFDSHFASWLDESCELKVEIAQTNTVPLPGHVYISPADFHLTLVRHQTDYTKCRLFLSKEPPVHFLRPAVDKLFESAARVFVGNVIPVILTGMGHDGTQGCMDLYSKGALTIAQSEETCVMYGMPKSAVDAGCITQVVPLDQIAHYLRNVSGL